MINLIIQSMKMAFYNSFVIIILGPIGLPFMILLPLAWLLFVIALGMVFIGLIIFFVTGGTLFVYPVAWILGSIELIKKAQAKLYVQRMHLASPMISVILTYFFLLLTPLGLLYYGFLYESLYVFITSYGMAVAVLRKPAIKSDIKE